MILSFQVGVNNLRKEQEKKGEDSLVSVTDISGITQESKSNKLIIRKNKLNKQIKINLELKNMMKRLKHPFEFEGNEDSENRVLLLTYSQLLSEVYSFNK